MSITGKVQRDGDVIHVVARNMRITVHYLGASGRNRGISDEAKWVAYNPAPVAFASSRATSVVRRVESNEENLRHGSQNIQ